MKTLEEALRLVIPSSPIGPDSTQEEQRATEERMSAEVMDHHSRYRCIAEELSGTPEFQCLVLVTAGAYGVAPEDGFEFAAVCLDLVMYGLMIGMAMERDDASVVVEAS